jgi:hypothetical protein
MFGNGQPGTAAGIDANQTPSFVGFGAGGAGGGTNAKGGPGGPGFWRISGRW